MTKEFSHDCNEGEFLSRQKSANSLTLPAANNYTTNSLNQYTGIAGLPTRIHDADGNLTSGVLPVDENSTSTIPNSTFTWDAENRLIAVTKADNTIIRFSYDYQSRRISKGVDGSPATYYIYDGWNMIADYKIQNSTFTIQNTYLWGTDLSGSMQGGGGVGGLLQVTDHGSSTTDHFFPTYDGNGNISEYLDNTGTIVAHYEYSPFGRVVVSSGAKAADFEHKFSTKPQDSETGLYYYGYRYYDPVTGRWPSRDPIKEKGHWLNKNTKSQVYSLSGLISGGQVYINSYTLVGNAPIVGYDINGEWAHVAAGAVIGGVIGGVTTGSWEGALAGAVGGAVTAATFNPAAGASAAALVGGGALAGAAGGAAAGLVQEGINAAQGEGFDAGEVLESAAIGAVTGAAGGGIAACSRGASDVVEAATEQLENEVLGATIGTVASALDAINDTIIP